MSSKITRAVVRLAGIAAIAALVNVGVANAARQVAPKAAAPKAEQAAKPKAVKPKAAKPVESAATQPVSPDGFHNATRLGGSRSLIGAMRDLKRLKLDMARPRTRKDIQTVLDVAGMSPAVRDELLNILIAADPSQLKDETFPVGNTMLWMGLRNKGKGDILRNVRWNGARPFAVWAFDIDDGETLYHFVLPKPCGNLALASSERSPKAIAAENARKAEEARRAEEARKIVPPPPPPPPLPPPPPASASCGLTASAVKAKGGWSVSIDGGQSQSGGSPAAKLVVQILGPTGEPVSMEYQGKAATELSLAPPFQATVLLRKALSGSYTIKAASTASNPSADNSNCEATFTIIAEDNVDFFVEGDFGKERRVRDALSATVPPVTFGYGFCAPLFGGKVGADVRLAPGWRMAPSIGVALNTREASQSSLFAEVEINRWFGRKGFIGTGIGVWDFTHGDTVAPVWLLQGGRQVWKASGPKENELHFVVTGRLFLNKMDDIANNYQFWAGLRYIIR